MASNRQGFGKKIGQILQARDEDDAKLALLDPVPQPMEPHIQRLRHLGVTVLLARPIATSLSQKIVVAGCG